MSFWRGPVLQTNEDTIIQQLSWQDRALLMDIYRKRRRNYLPAFCVVMVMLLSRFVPHLADSVRSCIQDMERRPGQSIIENDNFIGSVLFTAIPVIIISVFVAYYVRQINSFYKDASGGVKLGSLFTVQNKLAFPNTGQYFVTINHPDFLHYEVTADVYAQLHIGNQVVIYRAPHSHYVFSSFNRYSII